MIQVIKYKDYPKITSSKDIIITNFKNFKSFDLYDLNIICLNDKDMWINKGSKPNNVSCANDICKIKKCISTCSSKCIIILPINGTFNFSYGYGGYAGYIDLKNMLPQLVDILNGYIYDDIPNLEYEPGQSTINDITYNYDFYFEHPFGDVLVKGDKNEKTVAICHDNVVITTLQLTFANEVENSLANLLNELYKSEIEPIPEWLNEYLFLDDKKYLDSNKDIDNKIDELIKEREKNNEHLSINNHFKSILYESGSALQKIVIEIIEDILGKHNDFEDVSEEDYLFKSNNYTFVVETKGLNGSVQGKHVNDAIAHLTIYEDNLEQQGIEENTKCLFIVASERLKRVEEREKIKDRNITIANRNNALIIDTPSLLTIYADFKEKKIKKDEIIKMFIDQKGLIEYKSR